MKVFFRRFIIILSLLIATLAATQRAEAISFALDSIAEWGKFPRFCVNTYRWGDKFFNGYDTTYVKGTGYKFNVKLTSDSWVDAYNFELPNDKRIFMRGDPSSSLGIYLSYLAVSVGYDMNLSKIFGGIDRSRERWRFGFNCSLLAAEVYYSRNDVGTTITRFGDKHHPQKYDQPFNGVNNNTWGLDAYYFFNHKEYSEAAAFSYSRVQIKSQGSFHTGLSIYAQKLDFNFSSLPIDMKSQLPSGWLGYRYHVNTNNYALRFGYGYNWVFARGWLLGVSESPVIGIRHGFINSDTEKVSLSIYNRLKAAVVWNSGRWFAGINGRFDVAILSDKESVYAGGVGSVEAVIGCRFNLW